MSETARTNEVVAASAPLCCQPPQLLTTAVALYFDFTSQKQRSDKLSLPLNLSNRSFYDLLCLTPRFLCIMSSNNTYLENNNSVRKQY